MEVGGLRLVGTAGWRHRIKASPWPQALATGSGARGCTERQRPPAACPRGLAPPGWQVPSQQRQTPGSRRASAECRTCRQAPSKHEGAPHLQRIRGLAPLGRQAPAEVIVAQGQVVQHGEGAGLRAGAWGAGGRSQLVTAPLLRRPRDLSPAGQLAATQVQARLGAPNPPSATSRRHHLAAALQRQRLAPAPRPQAACPSACCREGTGETEPGLS